MPGLIWSAKSLDDLAQLDRYLADRAPGAAVRIIDAVRSATQRIIDHPHIGRRLTERVRVWRVSGTPYLVQYAVDPDAIGIVRILHERQDWRTSNVSQP